MKDHKVLRTFSVNEKLYKKLKALLAKHDIYLSDWLNQKILEEIDSEIL